jgi:hypothetical protein
LYRQDRDSLVLALPSLAAARRAICEPPLVAQRYGEEAVVGDRLALQFVYQLFPRSGPRGCGRTSAGLWRRYLTELREPGWVSRGVANLRNLDAEAGLPDPLALAEGVSILSRSLPALRSLGFSQSNLDALVENSRSAGFGFSQHVLCVEHRPAKALTT